MGGDRDDGTDEEASMVTLRIEHAVTDLDTWLTAFGAFAEVRTQAGVRAERLLQPEGADRSISLDLDFDDATQARDFEQFLRTNVWSSRDASPALDGEVQTTILVLRRSH
ncbi:MAG TPA: hypothetical protein VHZ05_09865 [Acidimicrobiales bacterium]|nr:hypothetical protein [Acidimicrobiales bacterium]